MKRTWLVLSSLLCGSLAGAAPRDVGVQLGADSFDTIGKLAVKALPKNISAPDSYSELLSCPFGADPISLELTGSNIGLNVSSVQMIPQSGAADLAMHFDIDGGTIATLRNGIACLGSLQCGVRMSASNVAVSAQMGLAVADGKVSSRFDSMNIDLAPEALHIEFYDCILQHVSQNIIDWVIGQVFKQAKTSLIDIVKTTLPPLLDAQLGNMLTIAGDAKGFTYAAALDDATLSTDGLEAYLSADIRYNGPQLACGPTDASAPVSSTSTTILQMADAPKSPIRLGIAIAPLQSAITAAWKAGFMCVDKSVLSHLGFDLDNLAALIPGLPKDTRLDMQLSVAAPPQLVTGPDGQMRVTITGAQVALTLSAPNSEPSHVIVSTDLSVALVAELVEGYVQATLGELSVERLEITSGENEAARYSFDPARIDVLMKDIVIPMAQERMRGLPLAPAAFGANGLFASVDALRVTTAGLYAGLLPFVAPESDGIAPFTAFKQTPSLYARPGRFRLVVRGDDDQTPERLLRYTYQLDDGPESAASFGNQVFVPISKDGTHKITVRALDLNGNRDSTGQSAKIIVDATPPVLDVIEAPDVALRGRVAVLRFAGSDDNTANNKLTYALRIEEGLLGKPMHLKELRQPALLDGATTRFQLDDLPAGSAYKVTLMLYDEAGNVTSQLFGFSVTDNSGCNMSSHGQPLTPLLSLLAVAALLAHRRHRRRSLGA